MKTFRWTEEQKKALRGSIRKWQRIVNGTLTDEGVDNCACCRIWWSPSNGCEGCPISEFSGDYGCRGTPYEGYVDDDPDDPRFRYKDRVAVQELNFLKAVYLAGGGK